MTDAKHERLHPVTSYLILAEEGLVCVGWFGNSASIHERLHPVTSYLSMNGVDVVDSNGCQEQHVHMHISEILGV